ncbi:hypothetical protein [Pendulispora albinea]|uniref:Uncharacterized protein n=1 Tax=Pendulispora albinea TaxID=2741071 RepID=A0ABZ2LRZ9_9BACT
MNLRAQCTFCALSALLFAGTASGDGAPGARGAPHAQGAPGSLARVTISEVPAAQAGAAMMAIPPPSLRLTAREHAPRIKAERAPGTPRHVPSPSSAGCLLQGSTEPAEGQADAAPQASLASVRLEELVEPPLTGAGSQGSASLDVEDFFVDGRTGGARSAARWSIPLQPIATIGLARTRIYAYRDDASVHLLSRRSEAVNWFDVRDKSVDLSCAHMHIRLDLRDVNGPRSSAIAAGWFFAKDAPKPSPMHVHLSASLSRSSRDREPLLSVGVAIYEAQGGGSPLREVKSVRRLLPE